jgi:glycosyltransferase involved in cell wall biosynthesis
VDLSVVIPVYNGAAFLPETLDRLQAFLDVRVPEHEIIVVDDGSTDGTAASVLPRLSARTHLITLPRNQGKFAALKAGMAESTGRCCLFTDADLPYELEALPYIASLINDQGFHIVVGDRTLRHSVYRENLQPIRRLATRAFSLMVTLFVTGGLFDTQCGLKGFRGDVARSLFALLLDSGFSGDVELLYLALKYNLAIRRVPVRLKRSAPSTVRITRHAVTMVGRIARLRRNWAAGTYASPELERLSNQSYWDASEGRESSPQSAGAASRGAVQPANVDERS